MSKKLIASLALPVLISAIAGGGAGYFASQHAQKAKQGTSTASPDIFSQEMVRRAIMERPEIIEEAIYALQAKRQAEASTNKSTAIAQSHDALYNVKYDPVLGTDNAPLIMVEFFDYNCGFCKMASKWVKSSLDEHPGKIKIIMKDFPILEGGGNGSREAAAAAWAVRLQGRDKYQAFHFALMNARGGFNSARIDDLASKSAVDVAQMRADMKKNAAAFEKLVNENFALAQKLGINGTPAFISGATFVNGANTEKLQTLLDAALAEDS